MKNQVGRVKKLLSRFGFGSGRQLDLCTYQAQGHDLRQLHLGCGNIHIPGWCNVDVIKTGATDLVLDISTLPGLPKGAVERIYSCHVLEHFSQNEIADILAIWYQVLKPHGEIRISVPDLDAITRIYQDNLAHFNVPGNQPWIALIYGGQKDQFDYHKTGFNFCWLKYLLEQAGFTKVERYANDTHIVPGVNDNSLGRAFGEFISLNVVAKKGS